MLGVVEFLRFFEHFWCPANRDDSDAVLVGGDEVAGIDAHAGARDGDVHTGDTVVVDRR